MVHAYNVTIIPVARFESEYEPTSAESERFFTAFPDLRAASEIHLPITLQVGEIDKNVRTIDRNKLLDDVDQRLAPMNLRRQGKPRETYWGRPRGDIWYFELDVVCKDGSDKGKPFFVEHPLTGHKARLAIEIELERA